MLFQAPNDDFFYGKGLFFAPNDDFFYGKGLFFAPNDDFFYGKGLFFAPNDVFFFRRKNSLCLFKSVFSYAHPSIKINDAD